MQIDLLRDIPLTLGITAMLIGIFRKTSEDAQTASSSDPQWMCRVVFFFIGFVLIGFGVLGNYSPH